MMVALMIMSSSLDALVIGNFLPFCSLFDWVRLNLFSFWHAHARMRTLGVKVVDRIEGVI